MTREKISEQDINGLKYVRELPGLIDFHTAAFRCQADKNIMRAQPVSNIEAWKAASPARSSFSQLRRST